MTTLPPTNVRVLAMTFRLREAGAGIKTLTARDFREELRCGLQGTRIEKVESFPLDGNTVTLAFSVYDMEGRTAKTPGFYLTGTAADLRQLALDMLSAVMEKG